MNAQKMEVKASRKQDRGDKKRGKEGGRVRGERERKGRKELGMR